MDGYSVEEASEVLGIPQGRVWELLARGVLAGSSQGTPDVRVFLRPPAEAQAHGANGGNGGASAGEGRDRAAAAFEATPFRELLTEFRNLTERYGQALLALGEARGEVAALRGRVELLEARMDFRLPGPARRTSTVAWELPDHPPAAAATPPPPPAQEEPGSFPAEPLPGTDARADVSPGARSEEAEPGPTHAPADARAMAAAAPTSRERRADSRRRRLRTGRAALVGIAEALARAQDPALPDLPGAREAADALAALRRDVAEDSTAPETVVTQEDTPAASPPAAAPPPPVEEEVELASFGLTAAAPAIAAGQLLEEEPEAAAPEEPDAPMPVESEAAPALEPSAPAASASVTPPETATVEAEPLEADESPEPYPAEPPLPRPASIYSTEVVEPDWFADGDLEWPADDVAEPDAEARPVDDAAKSAAETRPGGEPAPAEAEATGQPAEPASSAAPPAERPSAFGLFQGQPSGGRLAGGPLPDENEPAPEGPAQTTLGEEELLWLGDEFDATELEVAAPGSQAGQPSVTSTAPDASGDETPSEAVERGNELGRPDTAPGAENQTPVLELSDAELARLAEDEGWDMAEVDAIRGFLGRPRSTEPARAPGPEEARPASDAGPGEPTTPGDEVTVVRGEAPVPSPGAPAVAPEAAAPPPEPGGAANGPPTTEADWIKSRRGPAATAYRRLRRLFQG